MQIKLITKMGVYDIIIVNCPICFEEHQFQSKSGDCTLSFYSLKDCPKQELLDVNRHSPCKCDCGTHFEVDINERKAVIL